MEKALSPGYWALMTGFTKSCCPYFADRSGGGRLCGESSDRESGDSIEETTPSPPPDSRRDGIWAPGSGSRGLLPAGVHFSTQVAISDQIESLEVAEMVATVGAATPVSAIRDAAARHGLISSGVLPDETGTIGGLFSDPREGPADPATGRFCDHVLGIEGVRGDGSPILSGGTVVKNVTGYDLIRLMGGALGALGVITRLHIRLETAAACWKSLSFGFLNRPEDWSVLDQLRRMPFEPYLMSIKPAQQQVQLLLSGTQRAVDEMASFIRETVGDVETTEFDREQMISFHRELRSREGTALRIRVGWKHWCSIVAHDAGTWRAICPSAGYGLLERWQPGSDLDFLVEKVASVGGSVTAEDVEACERSGIPMVHASASDTLTRSLRMLWDADGKIPWQGDR